MDQLPVEQSEELPNHISAEIGDVDPIQSSCTSSDSSTATSMDFLLLIFVRYLQLIQFFPWLPQLSIANGPTETPKHTDTNALLQDTMKKKENSGKTIT